MAGSVTSTPAAKAWADLERKDMIGRFGGEDVPSTHARRAGFAESGPAQRIGRENRVLSVRNSTWMCEAFRCSSRRVCPALIGWLGPPLQLSQIVAPRCERKCT